MSAYVSIRQRIALSRPSADASYVKHLCCAEVLDAGVASY
jgi:hypothetical protein